MAAWRTPWRAVTAMFMLNGALLGIWASRISAIKDSHGLTPGTLGALLLLLAAGAITAFALAGRAADRFGAAPVTRRIAVGYVLALMAIAAAPTLPLLALALFAFGAVHGAMDVTMNTWAGEVEAHMGRPVMSSFHAMFSVGAGLGAATGWAAGLAGLGPGPHFALAGLTCGALAAPFALLPWASARRPGGGPRAPVLAVPRGRLALVGVLAFCAAMGEGAMTDWSAVFLTTVAGADAARAALGFAVFSVAMVAMRLAGDRVIARLGVVRAAQVSGGFALAGVVVVVGGATTGAALAGFALMGLGYALIFPLAFSRAAAGGGGAPGAAIASVATLGYGGLLLGPPAIGLAAELVGLRWAFALLALLAVVIATQARALRRI